MTEKEKIEIIEKWADFLSGSLSDREHEALEQQLNKNPDLRKELESEKQVWDQLDLLADPIPSIGMNEKFQQLHSHEKSTQIKQLPSWKIWATGIAASLVGILIGYQVFQNRDQEKLSQLSEDVSSMREMLVMSLIQQPNAHDRIRAVKISQSIDSPEEQIIEALAETLKNDSNVNVRLAALHTLLNYWNKASAREAVIAAIPYQDSPLVQTEIADAMIGRQAKSATEALKTLIENPQTMELVKEKLTSTIEELESI